ncbi:hypothetical protein [Paludibaculum fermentans]|uniref:Uncharacterized protein n=1 Tax=Paludibaculum fermentans TaxID=1473598 RepID=A0A7S7SNU3_PALFE|nr:hypothetical protein [Paludibaculum fermentans]QOY91839.1 hypothetical protein IRI77_18425 [Paludibaculum fermentans]
MWPFVVILGLAAAPITRAALPEPPNQHKPWTPPESKQLPEYMSAAVAALFEAGLADPRGGVYREIEVLSGDWSNRRVKTRGWVFPEGFAVCWNGLVYRTLSVGEPGDLDMDVQRIIASDPKKNGDFTKDATTPPEVSFWFDLELRGSMVPASTALLLRLNRPDLAGALWRAYQGGDSESPQIHPAEAQSFWFRTASRDWLITAFHRLAGHFLNADDRDAVEVGESLVAWGDRLRASMRKDGPRGIARLSDIDFLNPVPEFLSDARRRLGVPAKSGRPSSIAIEAGGVQIHDPFQPSPPRVAVAELIDRLEDIAIRKGTNPGSEDCSTQPVAVELLKLGEEAVEPLLDALQNDRRLTRSLESDREWSIHVRPVWVYDVVKRLLGILLDAPDVVARSSPTELRQWWEQNKAKGRGSRRFERLADDAASPETWVKSAEFLARRSDVVPMPGWIDGPSLPACDPSQPRPPLAGEAMRRLHGREVAELMPRRVRTLAESNHPDEACRIAFAAYLWEPESALPSLQFASRNRGCARYPLILAARIALHDPLALKEWADSIRVTVARQLPGGLWDLAPLWMYPDNPVIAQTAQWLADRSGFPLSPAIKLAGTDAALLAVPAIRRVALKKLADSTVIGRVTRDAAGALGYRYAYHGVTDEDKLDREEDAGRLARGRSQKLRMKDLLAWELTGVQGAPKFMLDWPASERNAAIQAIAKYIETNAHRFRAKPARLEDVACSLPAVYLAP